MNYKTLYRLGVGVGIFSLMNLVNVKSTEAQSCEDVTCNQTGNVLIGKSAGDALVDTLQSCTFVGSKAGKNATSGKFNTGLGQNALQGNSTNGVTGDHNTGVGYQSLNQLTSGEENIGVGYQSLYNLTTGSDNIAMGYASMKLATTGSDNVALGEWTLKNCSTCMQNVAIGDQALLNSTGDNNIGIGQSALSALQSGHDNVGFGFSASVTSSTDSSVVIGSNATAGSGSAEGDFVVAVGCEAEAAENYGVALGHKASTQTVGSVAIGYDALVENDVSAIPPLSNSIAIGNDAFVRGDCSIALGASSEIRATSNDCVAIGCGAFIGENTENSMALGAGSTVNSDNTIVIGNTSVGSIGGYEGWTNLSDGRFKSEVENFEFGLDFILKLRPVEYVVDNNKLNEFLGVKGYASQRAEKDKKLRHGFIAQEVLSSANELGFEFSGVVKPQSTKSHYGLRYATFVVPLVKAVQEQQEMIEASEAKNEAAEEKIEALQGELDALKAMVEDLAAGQQRMDTDLQQCCFQYEGSTGIDPSTGSGSQLEQPKLEQNQPNPFKENTIIKYYLPQSAGNAQLTVSSLDGKVLESFKLDGKGFGQVLIDGGSLSPGTYIYTLEIAGQRADSKRMILK